MINKRQRRGKPVNSRKSERFCVRLTPMQWRRFEEIANELGITRADLFVKWLLKGK